MELYDVRDKRTRDALIQHLYVLQMGKLRPSKFKVNSSGQEKEILVSKLSVQLLSSKPHTFCSELERCSILNHVFKKSIKHSINIKFLFNNFLMHRGTFLKRVLVLISFGKLHAAWCLT